MSLRNLPRIFFNQILPQFVTSFNMCKDANTPLTTKKTSSYKNELLRKTESGELKNSVSLLRFEYGTRPIGISLRETNNSRIDNAFKPCKHLISSSLSESPISDEKLRFAEKQFSSLLSSPSLGFSIWVSSGFSSDSDLLADEVKSDDKNGESR